MCLYSVPVSADGPRIMFMNESIYFNEQPLQQRVLIGYFKGTRSARDM